MTSTNTIDKDGILYAYDTDGERLFAWGQKHGLSLHLTPRWIEGIIFWDTMCLTGTPPFRVALYRIWGEPREKALGIMEMETKNEKENKEE